MRFLDLARKSPAAACAIALAAALCLALLLQPGARAGSVAVGPGLRKGGRLPGFIGTGVTEVPDEIRVLMPDGAVATMDMDEYLKGVVPSEVPASWPFDALAAQAVAARSYASTSYRHPQEGANVCTTTHCQVYDDQKRDARTDVAVESTNKVAALYRGEIISAFYFGHCDGYTRNSEDVWGGYLPYCRSVACPCGYTQMFGHGVGMCQQGSRVMAENGWGYRDILRHYYSGVDVESTEPVALTWYFAEGTTRPGFSTYLCLGNPSDDAAQVTITYMVENGENKEVSLAVEPGTRKTLDVESHLGGGKDFSTRISSTNGVGIVAERPMYFEYRGLTGGHDTIGAPYPKAAWYFAEGTTRPGFSTYLCLGNPSGTDAQVEVTYHRGNGFTMVQVVTVPAGSRATVHTNDFLGSTDGPESDVSIVLDVAAGTGIVAERPMYFNYRGLTGGHDTIGH